jgi:hypothetical protein
LVDFSKGIQVDPDKFLETKRLGKEFRSGKRWAAPANPQTGNNINFIGNSETMRLSFRQTEIPAMGSKR